MTNKKLPTDTPLIPPTIHCPIHGKLIDLNKTIVAGKWICRICRRMKVKRLKKRD